MANFTPGPWKAFTSPDGWKLIGVGQRDTGEGITDCGFGLWGGGAPEVIANANLIAAAPELFHILEVIRDADDDCGKDGLPHNLPSHIRALVDRALSKAQGTRTASVPTDHPGDV